MSCSITSSVMAGSRFFKSAVIAWDSAGESPAVGSSSSSRRGGGRGWGEKRVTPGPNRPTRRSVGGVSPLIKLNRVVLPAPFGPMMARRSPDPTARLTPSSARSPPNSFERSVRLSAGLGDPVMSLARPSAVLARRKVPVVHGLLQEIVRLILPELRDGRIGMDDGVPELAVLPLDLADVDVLDRVAVGVELDRAAGSVGDLHPAQRLQELLAVLHVAADDLGRLVDPSGAGVAGLREVRRDLPVPLAIFRDEFLVHRRVEGGAVDQGGHAADGLVTEGRQHELVKRRAAADEAQLHLQPGVLG